MLHADIDSLVNKAKAGFATLPLDQKYKDAAIANLKLWLSNDMFQDYAEQIIHLIKSEYWDYLLDCFYQVIPFGTGGRRGEVGVGPNRINSWTIRASAQGHSQYLINQYGDQAKTRGIVITYDVREFFGNKFLSPNLPNPVQNLTCLQLAKAAAEVYAAAGIKTYFFDGFRTTPELSFTIRHLNAIAGDMISASHNPPEHNGKKVYDEFGGQLIPPHDENLVNEVTQKVHSINSIPFQEALDKGLIVMLDHAVDEAYWTKAASLSMSKKRDINILYTPLNGTGITSVYPVLSKLGFHVELDPKTSSPSGKFEHITFNIPNPEVIQSFDTALEYQKDKDFDIILNSDPDADRIGIMVKHQGSWQFLNGNEIAAILTEYAISKKRQTLKSQGIVIKTQVTSNLVKKIAEQNGCESIDDLLVGFKYVGEIMNRLEKEGRIDDLVFACEESHGYISGNYSRDKDAVVAAIWLSELAAELKEEKLTLVDYLTKLYAKYGYFRNYLTEIRLPGAQGMSQIQEIQQKLKNNPPQNFGRFVLDHVEDWMDRLPIVSQTDEASKNGIVFYLKPIMHTTSIRITLRPSGTEPKTKAYFEIGSQPFEIGKYSEIKKLIESIRIELEKAFMTSCYKAIGVDFPERGFLLFWQLPLKDKLHYFEIEQEIVKLKDSGLKGEETKAKLSELLSFLGSDPIQKVDEAFKAEYGQNINSYLAIKEGQ